VTERRTEILEAALGLFSKKGYHDTSMQDLGEALGLQRGSLYTHIRSKEELLLAIVKRGAEEFLKALLPVEDMEAPAPERLREAMRRHIGVVARNLEAATVFFHEWRFLPETARQDVLKDRDRYEGVFRSILDDGIREGTLRPHDTRLSATLALSAGNWLYQWYDPKGRLTADEIADRFSNFILEGISRGREGAA